MGVRLETAKQGEGRIADELTAILFNHNPEVPTMIERQRRLRAAIEHVRDIDNMAGELKSTCVIVGDVDLCKQCRIVTVHADYMLRELATMESAVRRARENPHLR